MKRIIISLTFIVLLFCFSALLIGIIPALNENQTLYFSSTLAQVTATLFGLTVSAYVFLDGKLTKDVNSDDSLIDVIKDLQSNYKTRKFYYSVYTVTTQFAFYQTSCRARKSSTSIAILP